MSRIDDIANELTTDPLVRGYAGMTDEQARDDLNTVYRVVDVPTLSGSQLFEAIDVTEWAARSADQKENIRFVVSLGDNIQISPGTKARAMMANALSGATASLSNLGVLGSKTISRAEELSVGNVILGDIQNARAV